MIRPILKNDPNNGLKEGGESYFVITGANIGYIPHVTPNKKRPIMIV